MAKKKLMPRQEFDALGLNTPLENPARDLARTRAKRNKAAERLVVETDLRLKKKYHTMHTSAGSTETASELKIIHHFERWEKQLQSVAKGGRTRKKNVDPTEVQRFVNEKRKEHPQATNTELREHAQKKFGVSSAWLSEHGVIIPNRNQLNL